MALHPGAAARPEWLRSTLGACAAQRRSRPLAARAAHAAGASLPHRSGRTLLAKGPVSLLPAEAGGAAVLIVGTRRVELSKAKCVPLSLRTFTSLICLNARADVAPAQLRAAVLEH